MTLRKTSTDRLNHHRMLFSSSPQNGSRDSSSLQGPATDSQKSDTNLLHNDDFKISIFSFVIWNRRNNLHTCMCVLQIYFCLIHEFVKVSQEPSREQPIKKLTVKMEISEQKKQTQTN